MKILIIYATKTGTTAKAAALLRDKLTELNMDVTVRGLSEGDVSVSGYDAVCVGGPIRIGLMMRPVRAWLSAHAGELKAVPYGIFCCRCGSEPIEATLSKALTDKLDKSVLESARALGSFGGEMDIDKQRGFDRFVAKLVAKSNPTDNAMKSTGVDAGAIADFAARMAAL